MENSPQPTSPSPVNLPEIFIYPTNPSPTSEGEDHFRMIEEVLSQWRMKRWREVVTAQVQAAQ